MFKVQGFNVEHRTLNIPLTDLRRVFKVQGSGFKVERKECSRFRVERKECSRFRVLTLNIEH
jgi:hypothetical protein